MQDFYHQQYYYYDYSYVEGSILWASFGHQLDGV